MKQITKQNACHICRAKPDKWDKDTPFIYGYYVEVGPLYFISVIEAFITVENKSYCIKGLVLIDPDTKCRCTGKQDKDGVWMFERDNVDCAGDWWAGVITWQSDGAIGWCIETLYGDKETGRYGLNSGDKFKITGNTIEEN